MDGLSRTVGAGPTIVLGGRTFATNARILRHYGEIEAEIIRRRGNPFDMARQAAWAFQDNRDMAVAVVSQVADQAKTWRTVSITELWDWLDMTMPGRIFAIWLAIREQDDSLSFDDVSQMYSDEYEALIRKGGFAEAEAWSDGIIKALLQANGEDELGNSNTSPPPEREAETESTGTSSTGSSPEN